MNNQSPTFTGTNNIIQTERLYYLDWFRVFAILLVFLVHCSKIFDYDTTVVFNTVRSPFLSVFRDFSLLWVMPLFFVLSGAAVFLSKGPDKTWEFIKSRFLRLLVPLIIIGTFIINPLYVYIERLSSGEDCQRLFPVVPAIFRWHVWIWRQFCAFGAGNTSLVSGVPFYLLIDTSSVICSI